MRRLSIGSPYASISRARNRSRFFSAACIPTIPPMVFAALSVFAPKACAALGKPPSGCSLMARVFSSPATSGDLAVLTTCSITTGGERSRLWSEFAMLSPSLVSAWLNALEAQSIPDKSQAAQSYLLWTSRVIIPPEVMHRPRHLSVIAGG